MGASGGRARAGQGVGVLKEEGILLSALDEVSENTLAYLVVAAGSSGDGGGRCAILS